MATQHKQLIRSSFITIAAIACALSSAAANAGGVLDVIDVSPDANTIAAPIATDITITFNQSVNAATISDTSVRVFGRWSGATTIVASLSKDGTTLTLDPATPFSAGETVMVMLSEDLAANSGDSLQTGGYMFQFWTATASRPLATFTHLDTMTTRTTPGESSRAYGGIGTDLNHDGALDITIINEDTADLRVFMNNADNSGTFQSFTQPTYPVEDRASPSEPADFNNDGHTDICVANINANSVSILLGNGDGTFGQQQIVDVGSAPRGIAVLDVDGDGDTDIVNTNSSSSNLSLLINDGSGNFGLPTFFDTGLTAEWSLMAADMNNDGIGDLVVGSRSQQRMVVALGNGDGTFTPQVSQSARGGTWMIALGDVNNDGNVDVSTANSFSNNGAILLGDGNGQLGAPTTVPTDPFPLATDLGDVDGDGDLDWVTSSFQGDFFLFLNNGSGVFSFYQEFNAPIAASCALCLDIDNDLDLDLVLIDELEDVVMLYKNDDPIHVADFNEDGVVDTLDLLTMLGAWGNCDQPCPPSCVGDVDGSCTVDVADLLVLLAAWTT